MSSLTSLESSTIKGQQFRLSRVPKYRVLAAIVLRTLLLSAYAKQTGDLVTLPYTAKEAEQKALAEIIDLVGREGETESLGAQKILDLQNLTQGVCNPQFLDYAAQLVSKLSERYAVVAMLPAGDTRKGRYLVRHERVEMPRLDQERWSIKGLLQYFLGVRPVALTVNADNAPTCQSYHLLVHGPDDYYLADFELPVTGQGDSNENRLRGRGSCWRVQGKRGQNFLHVYTRGLQAGPKADLRVKAKFHEVPPGSIGRAAPAAIAAFCSSLAVAIIVSVCSVSTVDSDLAAFILALPGIAAAWLGFDSGGSSLLSGTLVARISLAVTFLLSVFASVALLLQKAMILPDLIKVPVIFDLHIDAVWFGILVISSINMLVTCYYYWEHSAYYRTLSLRDVDGSTVFHDAR